MTIDKAVTYTVDELIDSIKIVMERDIKKSTHSIFDATSIKYVSMVSNWQGIKNPDITRQYYNLLLNEIILTWWELCSDEFFVIWQGQIRDVLVIDFF